MKYNRKKYIFESADFNDYLDDYGVTYVLSTFFKEDRKPTQDWGVLIDPYKYQKALSEYTSTGSLDKFPTKYIYQWIGIIMKNTAILEANTELSGHSNWFPYEEVEDFFSDFLGDGFYEIDNREQEIYLKIDKKEFLDICESMDVYLNENKGIHKDGQYDMFFDQDEVDEYDVRKEELDYNREYIKYSELASEFNKKNENKFKNYSDKKLYVDVENKVLCVVFNLFKYFDDLGLYDWMVMPDGSEALSDFGLSPIYKIIDEYDDGSTPEETLVIVNKVLDVYHQRGDMSSIFIKGGRKSLSQISNGLLESKKVNEAADDNFSLSDLSSISSFKGRINYCINHLGNRIGGGSSRIVFQIDDDKVLKLAKNEKGLDQNIEEERAYGNDIFPYIYDCDNDGKWIISEFVLPARVKDFEVCFNMKFNDFVNFITACGKYRYNKNLFFGSMPEDEYVNLIETNEDLAAFDEYIGNYGPIVIGDMIRKCNYGLTQRNGEPHIVLLDSGLTDYVFDKHYRQRFYRRMNPLMEDNNFKYNSVYGNINEDDDDDKKMEKINRDLIKLRTLMNNGAVKFKYKKLDGSERNAEGTLKSSLIPKRDRTDGRKKKTLNKDCFYYYDLGKDDWRCFRKENFIEIK